MHLCNTTIYGSLPELQQTIKQKLIKHLLHKGNIQKVFQIFWLLPQKFPIFFDKTIKNDRRGNSN